MEQTRILNNVLAYCTKHSLIPKKSTVVVGLSGGPDSVALLHMLHTSKDILQISLVAAHLDHQWREQSADDMRWCKQLCDSLQIPFVTTTIHTLELCKYDNGSQEALARHARRLFFKQVAASYGADSVALGHHADDHAETFFIRLLRGTSLSGLTGIKPTDGMFVHPLLGIKKRDILTYLEAHSLTFKTDETNSSDAYLRNRVRATVIPALHAADERFETNFAKLLERLQETDEYLKHHTQELFDRMSVATDSGYALNVTQYRTLHPTMQYRILMHWLCKHAVSFPVSRGFMKEIITFITKGTQKKHSITQTWSLVKTKTLVEIVHE